MVYQKYGEEFRNIRLQHHLPLSFFEHLGISKATLSNFENGKNMMAFDKLDLALQEMFVTLKDYSIVINNGDMDDFIGIFETIDEAYYAEDKDKLKEIYEENIIETREGRKLIALSAKACYSQLERTEIQIIVNYLQTVTSWGLFELDILLNTIEQLDIEVVVSYLTYFNDMRQKYRNVDEYRIILSRIVLRAALLFIDEHDASNAQLCIERVRESNKATDTLNRIMMLFTEGMYLYNFEDRSQGKKKMQRALRILSYIEADGLYRTFRSFYKKRIK